MIFYGAALAVDATGKSLCGGRSLDGVEEITPDGTSSIVAGVFGDIGYNGDGIPATEAWLSEPNGVAVDGDGNLYISDWLNNRIRKVDTSGTISTIAGNGTAGFGGDGGPATSAMVNNTEDVAVDASGNLYIADTFNSRIRVVNRAGIIQTLAGTGNFGYNGDGLTAIKTNLDPTSLAIRNAAVYTSGQCVLPGAEDSLDKTGQPSIREPFLDGGPLYREPPYSGGRTQDRLRFIKFSDLDDNLKSPTPTPAALLAG